MSESYDLVVLGSGAAGLASALYAGRADCSVLVAEKAERLGGTTAMSGGCIWAPGNDHMAAAGLTDSPEEALTYIRALAPPGWAATEEPLWRSFVETVPAALRFIEQHSLLRLVLGNEPDPYMETPGAKCGRNVSPLPFRFGSLGHWASRIRPSPMPYLLAYNEITDSHLLARPSQALTRFGPALVWRKLTNRRAMGQALVAGLLNGCLSAGCTVRTGWRALRLIEQNNRVVGVVFATAEGEREVMARRGVVIATGGFEWNAELMDRHHPGERVWTASADCNTGDGLLMAAAVGADMAHLDQSLIMGTRPVIYDGQPHAMPAADYTLPHSMIVNQKGRRFVNEVQMNIGLALDERDPKTGERKNLPAWRIYDGAFVRKYRHALPSGPELNQAPTLVDLARQIDVDADGLVAEAERMSNFARTGSDLDFGRGSHGWDPGRNGDPSLRPNSCLGAIDKPPFHAFPIHASFLGTKGGPRTDAKARVLRADGSVIAGLYCAGNAMANPIGSKAVGAGTTLGPCLTWGYIAGRTASQGSPRNLSEGNSA